MTHTINKGIENHIFSCTPSSTDLVTVLAWPNNKVGCSNEMARANSGIFLPKHIVQAGNTIIVPDNKLILPSAIIESISFESLLLPILENVKSKEELLCISNVIANGDFEKMNLLMFNNLFERVDKTTDFDHFTKNLNKYR